MSRLSLSSAIDPLLVVAAFAALVGAFGGETAAVVAVVFGTYFPGRFWWTGGSFLRWDWLAALLGGLALCRRGRMFGAGGLLACAALVRVFPMFALAGAALAAAGARQPEQAHLRPLPQPDGVGDGGGAAGAAGVRLRRQQLHWPGRQGQVFRVTRRVLPN